MATKLLHAKRLTGLVLCSMLIAHSAMAQLAMTRSSFTGTYTAVSGAATAITNGTGTANFSSTTGTSNGDEGTAHIPMPFSFTYLGTTYTTSNFFGVCTNGYVYLFNGTNSNANKIISTGSNGSNLATTGTGSTTPILAPWWDDMIANSAVNGFTGAVKYEVTGLSPNRVLTIEYQNYPSYFTSTPRKLNFQVKLYETTNVIEFWYGSVTDGTTAGGYASESAVIGIKNSTGGYGNFIDGITGSNQLINNMLSSSTFPVRHIRFTPGAPTAIAAGTYTVGSGQTYPNITEAIADVVHRGVSGAVTFNLTDATYDNTVANGYNIFPLAVGPIAGVSATNKVTFTSNLSSSTVANPGISTLYTAAYLTINGQSTYLSASYDPTFALIGCDYVTLSKLNLTTSGTNLDRGIVVANISGTDGATNNKVQDVSITMNRANAATFAILQSSIPGASTVSVTAASGANSNNKYYNLTVRNTYNGIWLSSNSTTNPDAGCEIGNTSTTSFNSIGSTSVAGDIGNATVQSYGIRVTSQSGIKIYNNEVANVYASAAQADGILMETPQGTGATAASIYNNKVHDIKNTSTSSTTSVSGIRFTHTTTGTHDIRVYNNFIYAINSAYTGAASSTRQVWGINSAGTGGTTSNTIDVSFNSVRLDGTGNLNTSYVCFGIATTTPVYKIRNNIFANLTPAQGATSKHFGFYSTSATSIGGTGSVSNYNDVYIPNDAGTSGFFGLGSTTNYSNKAAWTATGAMNGQDANSLEVDPAFASATDLHSNSSSLNAAADPSYATNTAWVTKDIDDAARNTSTDIGADEFTPISAPNCATLTAPADAATNQCPNATVLTWTAPGSGSAPTAYKLYVGTDGSGTATPTNFINGTNIGNVLTYTLKGLGFNTTYYWQIIPTNGSDATGCSIRSFTTSPLAANAPLTQDLESCFDWQLVNGTSGTNQWVVGNATNNGGSNGLYISNTGGTTNNYANTTATVHVYKDVTFAAGVGGSISFDWKGSGETNYDRMLLYIAPTSVTPVVGAPSTSGSSNNTALSGATLLWTQPSAAQTTYTSASIPLSNTQLGNASSSNTVRFIFTWQNDGGGGSNPPGALDNINISVVTCGNLPTALTVPSVSATSATISWTAPSPAPGSGYEYYLSTSASAPTSGSTPTGSTGAGVTSATLSVSANTTYYFWVRSNCNGTDKSSWVGSGTFTTPCTAATVPWTEGFESVTPGTGSGSGSYLPSCWLEGPAAADWTTATGNVATYQKPRTGNNFIYTQWTADDWLYSPVTTLTAGTSYDYTFYYIVDNNAASTANSFSYELKYGNAQASGSMTNTIISATTVTTTSTYTKVTGTFTPSSSGDYSIGLHVICGSTTPNYFSFDDFSLGLTPSCAGAASGTISTASATTSCTSGFTVAFTASGYSTGPGSGYQWQVSNDNFVSNVVDISGATNPAAYTTPAINTPGTTYYRLKVTCTSGLAVQYSNAIAVTLISPPTYSSIPYDQSFESTWLTGCATNDRPDGSWSNVNTSGDVDASWRRDDDGASGGWGNITSYMYSPAGSDGSRSARFHSGYTSAGLQSWMDLYVNLSTVTGNKQLTFDVNDASGTDAIDVLLSTDGGATFPTTLLSGYNPNLASWQSQTLTIASNSATAVIRFRATGDFGSTDIGLDNIKVTPPCNGTPSAGTNPSSPSICTGQSTVLTVTGATTGLGITYAWEEFNGSTWVSAVGGSGASTTSYTTPALVAAKQYRLSVTCTNSSQTTSGSAITVSVVSPSVTGAVTSNPATACGTTNVTLSAPISAGATGLWFASSTSNAVLAQGPTYSTTLNAAATFYVSAIQPLGSAYTTARPSASASSPTTNNVSSGNYGQGLCFTAFQPFLLNSVAVWVGTSATFAIDLYDVTGATVLAKSQDLVGLTANSFNVVQLNFMVPASGSYRLRMAAPTTATAAGQLNRETGGIASPVSLGSVGQITGGYNNTTCNTNYFYFYDWNVTPFSCLSARSSVNIPYTSPPAVSFSPVSPQTTCSNVALNVTASGSGYTSYAWSNAAGNTAAVTLNPASSTTYTVTATGAGCYNTASFVLNVNPAPPVPTVGVSSSLICNGATVNLTADAGTPASTTIFTENFNGAATGWTTTNTSSGGTPSNAAWTLRPNGYTPGGTWTGSFTSNDASQFYFTNSDAQGSGTTKTTLTSPAINLSSGYTAATLNFYHHYNFYTAPDSAVLEVSTNGTNWTILQAYTGADEGSISSFALANVSLNSYLGNATVYIRFRYTSSWDFGWAVDNVSVTGTPLAYNYAWSSSPAGFTSSLQNPTGVAPTVATTYTVSATNATTSCYSTASVGVNVTQPSVAPTSITGTNTICDGNGTVLTAAGGSLGTGANYQWGTGSVVGTNPLVGETNSTLNVTPTGNTTYWVRIENNSSPCAATTTGVTQLVTVVPVPTANAGGALVSICQNTASAPMGGSVGGSATGGVWSGGAGTWTNANDPANATYTAANSESGLITLTLTTTGSSPCAAATATKTIYVNVCATWLGNTTQWSAPTNWSTTSVPSTCSDFAIIPTSPVGGLFPLIGLSTFSVGNLTIQQGATLTVNSGGGLNVCGNLTGGNTSNGVITGSGELLLVGSTLQTVSGKLNANTIRVNNTSPGGISVTGDLSINNALIMQRGKVVNTGTVTLISNASTTAYLDNFTSSTAGGYTGNLTVERYLTNTNDGYRNISSPVSTKVADLNEDFPVFGQNGVNCWYSYVPYPNVQYYNESLNNPNNQFQVGFVSYTGLNNTLTAMKGLSARIYPGGNNLTLDFTGKPYSGDKSFPITFTNTGTASADGWNMVGNCYPSPILWSKVKQANFGEVGAAYYVFQATGEYTGNWGSFNGTTSVNGATNEIAIGQGFWILANGNSTLDMNNGVRTATAATVFFKTENVQADEIRLSIGNGIESDEIVAYTETGATNGYDRELDALKMPGSTVSMSFSQAGNDYAINVLENLTAESELPLTLLAQAEGVYSISGTELNTNLPVYLKDKVTNTLSDLKAGSVNIYLNKGEEVSNRYSVVFKQETVSGIETSNESGLRIYSYDNVVVIEKRSMGNAQVSISNVLGQQLLQTSISGTRVELPLSGSEAWYALVKVQEGDQQRISKVLIKNTK